jgi:hypothetical protein
VAAVTLTGKFILTETSLCLICLSHQMHGFLAKSPSPPRELEYQS